VFLTFRTSSLRTWFCYYLVFTYDLRIEIIFSHNVITLLQDEAGTAAIKTIELDAVLGGRAFSTGNFKDMNLTNFWHTSNPVLYH
jgi:hypothetical protein